MKKRITWKSVSRTGLAALLALVATFGSSGNASAAPCLADAAGDATLSCTANDFGVGSVTVTNLVEPCTGEGDSFTFDGTLNIDGTSGGNADRYDVGFYIGADGDQALTGSCAVGIIPKASNDLDGDFCGDYTGSSVVAVPIANVTSVCADNDSDGFFDLAICTSYDNNAGGTCNSAADAIPGTGSKCRCVTVNTNQEIPHCDVNTDCVSDGNICTDEVCLGLGQPGADFFGCDSVNNTVSCSDGLFCNGVDVCSGGSCNHPGDPCAAGGICGDLCNEETDGCFDPAGTTCRAAAGGCDVAETCTGSTGACPANAFLSSQCRASTGVCDPAESCTGSTATCPSDSFLASSAVCRASAGECDVAEQCTGAAGACPANGFQSAATACTTDGNVCTNDLCDGSGTCQHNNNTIACDDGAFCTTGDVCSAGACAGTATACGDAIDCTADTCDETNNVCVNAPNDALCDDQDACTEDTCSAVNGCIRDLICADICRSPGYWKTHSGFEKEGSINVAQVLLDAVGPLQVCGQTISATSNQDSPYLDGLGLSSNLEGLCMRTRGVHQRQLYRQLVAAALNCAASGDANDCDSTVHKYIDVDFSACSDLCAGNPPAIDPPTEGECIGQLDCFNNGGQIVNGDCAFGTCASQPEIFCGSDHGSCPDFDLLPQECVRFDLNCHSQAMCNEGISFCPKNTRASSPSACKEARANQCTIDSCN